MTATIHAELYQIPMFIREGSGIKPGDLYVEYRESLAIAQKKPDLSKLDAAVREWFERNKR